MADFKRKAKTVAVVLSQKDKVFWATKSVKSVKFHKELRNHIGSNLVSYLLKLYLNLV